MNLVRSDDDSFAGAFRRDEQDGVQDLLQDGAQGARAEVLAHGGVSDLVQRLFAELELDLVERAEALERGAASVAEADRRSVARSGVHGEDVARRIAGEQGQAVVATKRGAYPHSDDGVDVRRVLHELRSRAIENLNEQFKGIFDGHGQVPTKGLVNTRRWALGAVLVYQLTLWYRHEHGLDLRVGLKPFLKAA